MGGLDSLVCSGTNCLSWILVLLSIFAVFYIVFFSFYKPSKMIKTFGLIYSGMTLLVMIVVLIFHVCLFTLLCSVFTIMLSMAILPVTMKTNPDEKAEPKKEEKPKKKKDQGGFVITQVQGGGYVVSLYNKKGICLATTKTVFSSIRDAKKQILVYREFGKNAPLENRTKDLVGEIGFPKFKMFDDKDDICYFNFAIDRSGPVFFSKAYESNKQCLKSAIQAQRAIESSKVFMSTSKLNIEQDKQLEETRIKAIIARREEIANRKPFKQVMAERWAEFKEQQAEKKAEKAKKRAELAEEKRLEREQLEREREEQMRIAAEEAERERLAEERRQREIEEIQQLQLIKEEKQRLERERAERERAERERLALEKIEKQRMRQERMDEEREERRKLKALQDEEDRLLKRRQELEKAEQEQLIKDKQLRERKEREKAIRDNEIAQREAKKRAQMEAPKKLVVLEESKVAKQEMRQKDSLDTLLEQAKDPELNEYLQELDTDENDPTRILDWSFEAKNNFYGESSQRKFYDIRNELLSYGLNEDASWKERRFFRNGKTYAIILFKDKIMNIYLALDPEKLKDSKYVYGVAEKVEKFKQTPFRFRVASDRVVKWVFELIAIMMSENGFEKGVYVPPAFVAEEPQTVDTLIKHGLIRENPSTTLRKNETAVKIETALEEKAGKIQLKRPVNMAKELEQKPVKEKLVEIKSAEKKGKKPAKKAKKKPVKKQEKKAEPENKATPKKVEQKPKVKEPKKAAKKKAKSKPKKSKK